MVVLTTSCDNKENKSMKETSGLLDSNPFSEMSSLPFQAPAFDKIKNEHFMPAMAEGIKEQRNEIQEIADNKRLQLLKIHSFH